MAYLNLVMLKMYLSHLKSNDMGHIVFPFCTELNERNCFYYFIGQKFPMNDGIYSGMGYHNIKNDTAQLKYEAIRTTFLEVKAYLYRIDSLATYHPEQLK